MNSRGNLRKMTAGYTNDDPSLAVSYILPVGSDNIPLNSLTGKKVRMEYLGKINCINCGREIKKTFAQGYCYPCFISLPQTEACMLHPEKCQAHLGISRDREWSDKHCLQNHYVYLALSPGLKVGVTRQSQVPVRWIDQGARETIKLALTPNRYTAGLIEVELKKHLSDKTNWRHMLTGLNYPDTDLVEEKQRVFELMPEEMQKYYCDDNKIYRFEYPVREYPARVRTLNLEKDRLIEAVLDGIKGQYLIFEGGYVLNIRKYGGYLVDFYHEENI
ncbi:MAG: DUF2797 domain-containing protein [Bacteroidota bacterium]